MDTAAVSAAIEALDVDAFWKNGYAILHDMYTPDEIEGLRAAAVATNASGGDLLVREGLSDVITDGRLIRVAQKLLDTDEIFYSGDSSVTINSNQLGWHKDNTDRIDGNAPDWDSRYTQLRFGIYCQDHVSHTGGLNLRVGSHDIKNLGGGECLYVQTRPGDLAVWSMRITHSGNGMLLKDPEAPFPLPTEQKNFAPDEVADADGDRIAVFAHLGANDSHGRRYADYLKTRTYMVNHWRKHPYTNEIRQAAKDAGLILRDMPAEVMNDPSAGLKELWEPFPYERDGQIVVGQTRADRKPAGQGPRQGGQGKGQGGGKGQTKPAVVEEPTFGDVARSAKQALRSTGRRGRNALRSAREAWRKG